MPTRSRRRGVPFGGGLTLATLRDELRSRLLATDGVLPGGAVFGGLEGFWIDAKLVAEVMDATRVQLRLTKPLIRELRPRLEGDARVELRKTSDWVTLRLRTKADAAFAGELIGLAAPLYAPAPGTASRPPPSGADLEKRRRWH